MIEVLGCVDKPILRLNTENGCNTTIDLEAVFGNSPDYQTISKWALELREKSSESVVNYW